MSSRAAQSHNARDTHVHGLYKGLGQLHPSEILWRDRYVYLLEHGYKLRPRYHPQWRPSWLGTDIPADCCEDFVMVLEDIVLDATQIKTNHRVSIKVVSVASDEVKIGRLLSSREPRNPNNHCVPVLDVLPDPLSSSQALLIMPFLRSFNDPPFEVIDEVVDFVRQTLEGLCFIHNQGVAHRDCATRNIMMDGRPLFPEDHHPVNTQCGLDGTHYARQLSRFENPVKYYFIDFGMSSYFREGDSPYVLGAKGADQTAPELSNQIPYNAYMLDVYILGHLYETAFLQIYLGLDFLQPLIFAMTDRQPERRPSAEAALRMFYDIRRSLNPSLLRWRLRKRNESVPERVVYDTVSAAKVGFNIVSHITNR
ncbi:hypothetical protein EUX98_g8325 [Antrodiella citrinella]|uniref:Protein kinase domain-containing protein n=1 Tax=Antrodiella citrinella TaxID=2447956 RepID=A0A4S4M8D2_9APHY|nr:hypothetical protein EUX98_g8325 [Antrodiella citrinella]